MRCYLFLICVLYIITNNLGFFGFAMLGVTFIVDRLISLYVADKADKKVEEENSETKETN